MWNINLIRAYYNAYDHTTLNAPVPVRSPKLSSIGPDQYLDVWPPGNIRCCRLLFYLPVFFILFYFILFTSSYLIVIVLSDLGFVDVY